LIDAGFWIPESLNVLTRTLSSVGVKPENIAHIFLSHAHVDHAGLAPVLARHFGTKVWAHSDEAPRLNGQQVVFLTHFLQDVLMRLGVERQTAQAMMAVFEEVIRAYRRQELNGYEPLISGQRLPVSGLELQVFHTPGHSPGSVCFLESNLGLVFSGDTLTALGPPSTIMSPTSDKAISYSGLLALEQSLRALSKFKPELVLSGHGPPAKFEDIAALAWSSFKSRRDAVLEDILPGQTPFELVNKKGKSSEMLRFVTQLFETRATLDALLAEGRLRLEIKKEIELFSPA
jgi:glyoxylase-like metal-dependent hydrolase (beta-lactamase superfamily II)